MINIHATAVSIDGQAVLLRGPSGCGKSDLALRLIDEGAVLIADDRTDLALQGSHVLASAPDQIAGLIEIRGIGLLQVPYASDIPVVLIADLEASPERLPPRRFEHLLGITVPAIRLNAFEVSSAARIRLAMRHSFTEAAE